MNYPKILRLSASLLSSEDGLDDPDDEPERSLSGSLSSSSFTEIRFASTIGFSTDSLFVWA
jgi:hypothetical protein